MRQKILDCLRESETPMTANQIIERTGMKRTTFQSAIVDFKNRGLVDVAFYTKGTAAEGWQQISHYELKKDKKTNKLPSVRHSPFQYLLDQQTFTK